MPDSIEVRGLRADTIIGLYSWERMVLQEVRIDLDLRCDLRAAGASDDVQDTVDYKSLTTTVRERTETSRYLLIESLADDVAECCLADPRVHSARVRISKPHALRHADDVAVVVVRTQEDRSSRPRHRVFVGVGSNIEPVTNVRQALATLHRSFGALRVSPAYRTAAVGYEGAPDFLNLVVELRTDLDVAALWTQLRAIEKDQGRMRTDDRNEPRTLDLDMLLFDDLVTDEPPVVLPDRLVSTAPFVLIPLADIAGPVMHPTAERTIAELRATLPADVDGVARYDEKVLF
jgi:2-amino-4-hydroxy-6-hydroxymethyldihydropteridine diphosphokinase